MRGLSAKQLVVACWKCFRRLRSLLCTLRIDQAKEAIKEAQCCDPDNVFTHFCVYKMATLEHNVEKGTRKALTIGCNAAFTSLVFQLSSASEALNAVGVLCKNPQSSDSGIMVSDTAASNLLSLAAQMALEVIPRFELTEASALKDCRLVDTFLHTVFEKEPK